MERLPELERDFQLLILNGVVTLVDVFPRIILGVSLFLHAKAVRALGRDDLIPPHKLFGGLGGNRTHVSRLRTDHSAAKLQGRNAT